MENVRDERRHIPMRPLTRRREPAVRDGTPLPTDGEDGFLNMRVIDAAYRAAGLPPRGT